MIYFNVDKAMSSTKGEYMVWFKNTVAPYFFPFNGSLNVIHSRIMGLTYPQFLRYVRDTYNARIVGKEQRYPSFLFPTEQDALNYANMLDKRFALIVKHLNLKIFDKK